MKKEQISDIQIYINKAKENFEYTLYRHPLRSEHDYWMYTVQVTHAKWGSRAFGVYVTKEAFPTHDLAECLAKNLGVSAVKCRLEQATDQGFPMNFQLSFDGWWII